MCAELKNRGWLEDTNDIQYVLQNMPNELHEMKAAFQESFKFRRPSMALDDMAAKVYSLKRMQPSEWEEC